MERHVNEHFAGGTEQKKPKTGGSGKESDIDSGASATKSIMPKIKKALDAEANKDTKRFLIDSDIDHYAYNNDHSWANGYRVVQMILSALFQVKFELISLLSWKFLFSSKKFIDCFLQDIKYFTTICDTWNSNNLDRDAMASIREIQTMIETAWMQGFDEDVII